MNSDDEQINLNNISHIWIGRRDDSFWVEGETMHNKEEMCFSKIFTLEKVVKII